ncbi:MAG: NADH-quinone oxidoreductase subunit J [Acidocella sp.]|nr:NADH-quinone oxidoreductase subunit J [Acidocella sp.]
MNANLVVFSILAAIAVLGAIGVVASSSAIRSALSLVVTFFVLAVLYILLGAEMIGITQVVVYAGAIMVLFLFVIMILASSNSTAVLEEKDPKRLVAVLLGIGLAAIVGVPTFQSLAGMGHVGAPDGYGAPQPIGRMLFTNFAYPFECVSILLLIGIVGSILLAKRRIR